MQFKNFTIQLHHLNVLYLYIQIHIPILSLLITCERENKFSNVDTLGSHK